MVVWLLFSCPPKWVWLQWQWYNHKKIGDSLIFVEFAPIIVQ
jgi:hypothetical protein